MTFSQPHFRKPYLAKSEYDWSIVTNTFGNYFHYFFYVMEKGKELSETDRLLENSEKKRKDIYDENIDQNTSTMFDEDNDNFLDNIDLFY